MTFRSSAIASSSTGGNLTATPSGVAANDYLGGWHSRDLSLGSPPTYPVGWTERADLANSSPDGHRSFYFDKDTATGSDSFTVTDGEVNHNSLICAAWSGRKNAAPRTAMQTTVDANSNTTPVSASFTGVTAVVGDDIAVFMLTDQTVNADRWTFSTIAGYTERQDGVAVDWVSGYALDTLDNASAGATGSLASTITRDSGSGNAGYRGIVVAIAADPVPKPVRSRSRFNLQQMSDDEDEGRFNELDVRNWFREALCLT